MKNKKLTIIIPVYNERKTIKKLVDYVQKVKISLDKEIILVDDYSKDHSDVEIRKIKNVKKVYLKKNVGKGGAIKAGLKVATGDYVIFQDADLEYDPNDYQKFIDIIQGTNKTIVLGNRFTKENRKHIKNTLLHWFGNKFLMILFNVLYIKSIPDSEPCYKMITLKDLKKVDVKSNRFEYDIELMCKLSKNGFTFKSVPIKYSPRSNEEGKKIRWTDGLIAAKVMIVERFKK